MYRRLVLGYLFAIICSIGLSSLQKPVSAQSVKNLSPGVLKVIEAELDARDAHTLPMPMPKLNATEYDPNLFPKSESLFGKTRQIVLYREVFQLEFSFIPLRQIRFENNNYWYMIYRIRNVGKTFTHEKIVDPKFDRVEYEIRQDNMDIKPDALSYRFFGNFSLEGWVENPVTEEFTKVRYSNNYVPQEVIDAIRLEEDPGMELLDIVEMAKQSFPVVDPNSEAGGKWGVAVWKNVDARIDYVSVFVTGLSNGYRLKSLDNGEKEFKVRTLQLNFWRPGDSVEQDRDVVDYGIPLTDHHKKQVEICNRYDLPGPLLFASQQNIETLRKTVLFESDAQIDLNEFTSPLIEQLNQGAVPESVRKSFTDAGVTFDGAVTVLTNVDDVEWTVSGDVGGDAQSYSLRIEPQYWEPRHGGGIRFIKSLDHLWIYR